MKRAVVLKKVFWVGRHTTEEYKVLRDLNDKALQAELDKMNAPYKKWFWEIIGDYNLSKKKDFYRYAEYCLQCATNQYCKDEYSKTTGLIMLYTAHEALTKELKDPDAEKMDNSAEK